MMNCIKKMDDGFLAAILLLMAAIIAIACANLQVTKDLYEIFDRKLTLVIFDFSKTLTIKDCLNDVLMSLFFFLVSLELKKEILIGELAIKKKAMYRIYHEFIY